METSARPRLRRFAFVVAAGLAVIAGLNAVRGHSTVAATLGAVAVCLALTGLVAPWTLSPLERMWHRMGAVLGWVNTRIILTVLFYVVVTPVGAVMRLLRDPLDRRPDAATLSYWSARPRSSTSDAKSYERQF